MADNILRLKVESSEYDAKLKKAAEGIRHLADVAHKGGGELTGLEKAELDYIKALGDMETKSRTAAGSTRELENAFKELTVIYNNLNDVEKADEGGKALAASLEKLKQRTIDAKSQLDAATKSLQSNESAGQSNSGALEQLASKFTVNIDALKLFNIGLQALDAALGVAKDAFFSSETNVDEWGRTVESAKGIYEGFLQSINTGDISGFLNNINQITAAAREAYNALDELGTRQTILNPERAKLQARSTELKATIRREGADSAAGKAAAAELKALEKPLTEAWKTESKLNRDAFTALVKERLAEGGINLNQKSFNAFMKTFSDDKAFQQLRQNAKGSLTTGTYGNVGITATKITDTRNTEQKLMDLFTDEWRQANSGYLTAAYNAQGSAASTMLGDARYLKGGKGGSGSGNGSPKQEIQFADDSIMAQEKLVQKLNQDWKTASGELRDGYLRQLDEAKAKLKEMTAVDNTPAFTMEELEAIRPQSIDLRGNNGKAQDKLDLSTAAFATSGTSNVDFSNYTSALQNAIKDANIGSELYAQLSEQLSDSSQVSQLLQQYIANGITGADLAETAQELKAKLMNGEIDDEIMQTYVDQLNEKLKEKFDESEWPNVLITFDADTKNIVNAAQQQEKEAQKMAKDWQAASSAIQAVGAAMNQIEDPAAKVMGTIAQAVATMALSYSQAAASPAVTSSGWGWIAFAATGIATMISSISAIKNATSGFANGGIIPGNSMSGDNLRGMTPDGQVFGLNAQEVVLNRAQVGNLASQLEGGGLGNMQLETRVDAEEIIIMLNNNGLRRGRGRYIDG